MRALKVRSRRRRRPEQASHESVYVLSSGTRSRKAIYMLRAQQILHLQEHPSTVVCKLALQLTCNSSASPPPIDSLGLSITLATARFLEICSAACT